MIVQMNRQDNLAVKLTTTTPADRLGAAARASLLAALDAGQYAVGLFDAEDRLVYGNAAFREGWGVQGEFPVTFDSMIRNGYRKKLGPIVDAEDLDQWLTTAKRKRRQGPSCRSFEVDLWDGRWFWLTECRLDDGSLQFIGQDITGLKSNERMLMHARDIALREALTDPLTQLPNRRSVMQYLERCLQMGVRSTSL